MLDEVGDVDVIRPRGGAPTSRAGFHWRMERLLGLESPFVRWWNESVLELGQQTGRGIDVVLGELVPYETAFSVEKVSRSLGVPWVADLQDPWALDEMWLYPSALHRLSDRARMRRTLRSATAVVMRLQIGGRTSDNGVPGVPTAAGRVDF